MKNGMNMCVNGSKGLSGCRMGFGYAKSESEHYFGAT
jgi:hypothetical protein